MPAISGIAIGLLLNWFDSRYEVYGLLISENSVFGSLREGSFLDATLILPNKISLVMPESTEGDLFSLVYFVSRAEESLFVDERYVTPLAPRLSNLGIIIVDKESS